MINMSYFYLTSDFMGSLERLTDNNKIPYGTIDRKTAESVIEKTKDYFIDYRLPAVSMIKSSDINRYIYNYSMFFASVMAGNAIIRLYLDFGLIPATFYPSSHDTFIENVAENLDELGLRHFRLPAVFNHKRKDVHKNMYDSWVSRIEAGELLKCSPEDVKMSEIYKAVMKFDTD